MLQVVASQITSDIRDVLNACADQAAGARPVTLLRRKRYPINNPQVRMVSSIAIKI